MTKTADDLRERLFAAIDGVRAGTLPVAEARTIAELSQAVIKLAQAENDHARITQGRGSRFLASASDEDAPRALPNGIVGVRRHLIKDD